ncbi:hypothetical protein [uncultured Imperialibacter sp.]|uniref:hypothetical protein n=1 Tax=uncultured Imperialibacter sp. TaxID=1672639 RepID=UPI0030DBBFDB
MAAGLMLRRERHSDDQTLGQSDNPNRPNIRTAVSNYERNDSMRTLNTRLHGWLLTSVYGLLSSDSENDSMRTLTKIGTFGHSDIPTLGQSELSESPNHLNIRPASRSFSEGWTVDQSFSVG